MNRISRTGSVLAAPSLILMAICASGCQLLVNPFTDELANRPAVTTPSVQVAREARVERAVLHRTYKPIEVAVVDGAVTHGPLYFEDPFEDKGSQDGKCAWTGEDYLYLLYGPGRFSLNSVLFPVSAMVTPPWVVMASDGRLSQQALGMDHDAERWAGASATEQSGEPSN